MQAMGRDRSKEEGWEGELRDWDLEKSWVFFFSEEEMAGRKSWRSMGDREKKAEREREELSGLWTVGSIVLLEICGGRVLKFERPFSGNGQDLEIFLFFWMVHWEVSFPKNFVQISDLLSEISNKNKPLSILFYKNFNIIFMRNKKKCQNVNFFSFLIIFFKWIINGTFVNISLKIRL